MTRNKKQYVAILKLQEGKAVDPPRLDMKGMSIKKATVNNRTREYFTNLIENEILKPEDINSINVLKAFEEFEDEIRDSLRQGEIKFLTPSKVNDIDSYANPERQQAVRGTVIWNELYPDSSINPPDKINLLKLKCETIEDLKPLWEIKNDDGSIKYKEQYDTIKKFIFEERMKEVKETKKDKDGMIIRDELTGKPIVETKEVNENIWQKYGFTVIALPKSVERIPEWLIDLIDYDSIIDDNIRVGTLILQSLGFKIMEFNNKEYYSSFLDF